MHVTRLTVVAPRRARGAGAILALAALCGATGCRSTAPQPAPLPPFLCQPCGADADCGDPANRCLDLSQGGVACGIDCTSASCPTGFLCATITGGGANCVPASGACPAVAPSCTGDCDAGVTPDDAGAPPDAGHPPQDAGHPPQDARPPQADAAPPSVGVSIIVEPGDNGAALGAAIGSATTSVHMTMYLLSSSTIINALIAAQHAGRDVRVVLNQSFPSGTSSSNASVYSQLQTAGVGVHWAPSGFTFTHEKCVIIDGHTAWIMTMNATTSSPSSNREYLAVDTAPADVAEAEAIFEADYSGASITPSGNLVVAPVNARARLVALIASANSTIDMEAEELSDSQIVSSLVVARGRGVAVKIVLADDPPSASQSQAVATLKSAGAQLVSLSNPYVHAKSLVVDGASAYVGSENFTTNSLVYNRELGVIFSAAAEVQKVLTTTRGDFAAGTAL
ncbi:MAG TPA: phospholipase D-like domain-containing protein [Polyangia bacterium]|jgi:phosphatidylserine/phosphatidylglycerophosphate/cardiolipin synthase-like enzyme